MRVLLDSDDVADISAAIRAWGHDVAVAGDEGDAARGDVDLVVLTAATQEAVSAERARRPAAPIVVLATRRLAGEALRAHALSLGADGWGELEALSDEGWLRHLVADRHDRVQWPRSYGERRVLVLSPVVDADHGGVQALRDQGFVLSNAVDPLDGLERMRRRDVQVVVIDGSDGRLDADALLGSVRRFDQTLGTLLLVADEAATAAAFAAGADAVAVGRPEGEAALRLTERAWLAWSKRRPRIAAGRRVLAVGPISINIAGWQVTEVADLAALRELAPGTVDTHDVVVAAAVEREAVAAEIGRRVLAVDDATDSLLAVAAAEQLAERRLVALARRLQEVDARRVELIEKLASAHLELDKLTTIDPGTGVLNRRGLEDGLLRALAATRRDGGTLAAALVDVDELEKINEQHGHAAGDAVLRHVADRVKAGLRLTDTLGRVGGDAFLFLMPQTRLAEARLVAERARTAASGPVDLAGREIDCSVSVGVVAAPWEATSLDDVLALGRVALRQTQAASSLSEAEDDPELVALCDRLLSGAGLRCVALPIVAVEDEAVVGYELLTRGQDGLFEAPEEFLRVARERGILTSVDLRCLRCCLHEAESLDPQTRIHLNLFPSTLVDTPADELVALLTGLGMSICLELSEEQLVGDASALLARLAALRNAGVKLAVDDVGKGRGTLESVMLLEPDVLKLDRELITGAHRDVRKERLLRRLVVLAANLSCEVIAEGVECQEELALLRELEVPFAQGFLWADEVPETMAPAGSLAAPPSLPPDSEA